MGKRRVHGGAAHIVKVDVEALGCKLGQLGVHVGSLVVEGRIEALVDGGGVHARVNREQG